MTLIEFWNKMRDEVELPFYPNDVESIESNAGSTWINLKDGTSYYITIDKCENTKDEL
jgi:hypothetical protein